MSELEVACGEQTHFSALASPAEKIAIFSAGEARAEKCVCSPQAKLEVMFGIILCHTYCSALNYLIVLGKYFLYVNALNNTTYEFDDFLSLVREKIKLEKSLQLLLIRKKILGKKGIFSVFIKLYCVLSLFSVCILICFFFHYLSI